jgi:integrase
VPRSGQRQDWPRPTAAGAKSYIFETRLHGKTIRLTIGDVRTWTIGKAQGEATRLKALTDQGIDPRQQVIEQRAKSGSITEPRIAHTKALAAAGLPHVSLHGLRRSFGTLCEWVEVPSGISAQIMGHKPSALAEKHYRRRPLDLLRMWHSKIEAWILKQAGIETVPGEGGLRAVK